MAKLEHKLLEVSGNHVNGYHWLRTFQMPGTGLGALSRLILPLSGRWLQESQSDPISDLPKLRS